MRRLPLLLALSSAALAWPASAEPYRDELPLPPYRLFASMLAQLQETGPVANVTKAVDIATPLVRGLDKKLGAHVEQDLRRALAADDRGAARAATVQLILLDAQDMLLDIKRDPYVGWAEAKIDVKKAFLDITLANDLLHAQVHPVAVTLTSDLKRLASVIRDADMTTPPETVLAARDAAIADMIAAREGLEEAAHGRGRGRP